jgi:tetratricopeptide (TPR) repeat protein
MFPVHSNQSRRLRRVNLLPDAPHANCSQLPYADANGLQALKDAYHLVGTSTQRHRFEYLSRSDQEMLLRQQAMDRAQQGDLAAAINLFTQLIHFNPNSASNYNNRGLLHFQNGQPQQALMDYHRALSLNPRLGKVYNNRANCYAMFGSLNDAIADYEMAIDLDPTDIRARLNLGITLRQLRCYEDAIEQFDLALQCNQFLALTNTVSLSTDIEGRIYAERGHTHHLAGDWNCAIADYQRALEHLPLTNSGLHSPARLRAQVRSWLHRLLSPLRAE